MTKMVWSQGGHIKRRLLYIPIKATVALFQGALDVHKIKRKRVKNELVKYGYSGYLLKVGWNRLSYRINL